jgi:hypothetical protein
VNKSDSLLRRASYWPIAGRCHYKRLHGLLVDLRAKFVEEILKNVTDVELCQRKSLDDYSESLGQVDAWEVGQRRLQDKVVSKSNSLFELKVMFPIQVQIQAIYGNDTKLSNPFTLNLPDPCTTATLNTHSLADMATTVLRASPELQAI